MSDSILGLTSARKAAKTKSSIHSCANMNISCSMVVEMVDKIRALEAQLSKSQWVNVEDRLPEDGQICFVYCKGNNRLECVPFVGVWPLLIINWNSGESTCPVTHWQPLPAPPAQEGEG